MLSELFKILFKTRRNSIKELKLCLRDQLSVSGSEYKVLIHQAKERARPNKKWRVLLLFLPVYFLMAYSVDWVDNYYDISLYYKIILFFLVFSPPLMILNIYIIHCVDEELSEIMALLHENHLRPKQCLVCQLDLRYVNDLFCPKCGCHLSPRGEEKGGREEKG